MRGECAGDLLRRSAQDYRDFSFEIEAGEIVIIFLGDTEAVADEDQWRFDLWGELDARAKDDVITQGQGHRLAVTDERCTGIFFHNFS